MKTKFEVTIKKMEDDSIGMNIINYSEKTKLEYKNLPDCTARTLSKLLIGVVEKAYKKSNING